METEYMGTKLKDIIIKLPFEDGTELECGVFAYYKIGDLEYFALLPRMEGGELDKSSNYMIYRVEKDPEGNPVVEYIEDDTEYSLAADYFAFNYLK